mgnify:CR=1 FL=1
MNDYNEIEYQMNENFDYCFREYSDFLEIKDDRFHLLRIKYIEIANQLEEYVKLKINKK